MPLEQHTFEEIYVVGVDHTVSQSGELVPFDSLEELLEHLKMKNPSVATDVRVLHGLLTPARAIPANLDGRSAFILLADPDKHEAGIMLDSDADTCTELAEEIEKIMSSSEISTEIIDIDDVFILYGYEISICLSINEDDIDDDAIKDCVKIAKAVERQLEEAEED